VGFGLFAAGVALFLGQVNDLFSDVQLTWGERRITGIVALITLGGFGLGGWVAARLMRALAEVIDVVVDQAEATVRAADLLEFHVVPALERAAVALARSGSAPPQDGRALAVAGVRQAIDDHRWEKAERLLAAFNRDYASAAEGPVLTTELAEERQVVVDEVRSRLDAAQAANDPERVIEFRDELTQHVRGEPLKELDQHVIKWLMSLVQRRLRTGTVRADVARLAERIAESFGDTVEGASLRSSLPTLRRSAGLCPRCAQPYTGLADACPACLTAAGARRLNNVPPAGTLQALSSAPAAVLPRPSQSTTDEPEHDPP
jgi:hypothetical protein